MAANESGVNSNTNRPLAGGNKKKRNKAGKSRPRRDRIPQSDHPHLQTKESGWHMNPSLVGIALTVIINIVAIAYNSGTILTRIATIEDRLKEHSIKLGEVNAIDKQMSSLQAELRAISGTLQRLERVFSKENQR